jgi:hypothetical protein
MTALRARHDRPLHARLAAPAALAGSGVRPVLRHAQLTLYGVSWSVLDRGLPAGGFEVPVVARGRLEGRFVCMPGRRHSVAEDRVLAASGLVDQVASAQLVDRSPDGPADPADPAA